MNPETKNITQDILQDNMDHTIFSWSKQKGHKPLAIERGEGVYLYTFDGDRILDFSSGLMNVNMATVINASLMQSSDKCSRFPM